MKSKIERIKEGILYLTHKEHRIPMKVNLELLEKEFKEQHEKELGEAEFVVLKKNIRIDKNSLVGLYKESIEENQKLKKGMNKRYEYLKIKDNRIAELKQQLKELDRLAIECKKLNLIPLKKVNRIIDKFFNKGIGEQMIGNKLKQKLADNKGGGK